VIARGELTKAITLRVQGASKSVQAAITAKGGSFEKIDTPQKQPVTPATTSAKKS
jgi:hypothetical protein